jgi:hypothetical protein
MSWAGVAVLMVKGLGFGDIEESGKISSERAETGLESRSLVSKGGEPRFRTGVLRGGAT